MLEALLPIAGQAAGQIFTNHTNKKIADQANKTTRYLAENAHQIETKDLIKAGLNPILSATKGGPGAAVPQQQIARMENPLAGLTNSATAMSRVSSEIDKLKSDVNLQNSLARKADEEADTQAFIRDTNTALQGEKNQSVLESKQRVRKIDSEIKKVQAEVNGIQEQQKLTKQKWQREKLDKERQQLENKLWQLVSDGNDEIDNLNKKGISTIKKSWQGLKNFGKKAGKKIKYRLKEYPSRNLKK